MFLRHDTLPVDSVGDVLRESRDRGGALEPAADPALWRPMLRDVDDDMVLEAAVNGKADAIVTFNRRDFEPTSGRFGIRILSPGATIEELGENL